MQSIHPVRLPPSLTQSLFRLRLHAVLTSTAQRSFTQDVDRAAATFIVPTPLLFPVFPVNPLSIYETQENANTVIQPVFRIGVSKIAGRQRHRQPVEEMEVERVYPCRTRVKSGSGIFAVFLNITSRPGSSRRHGSHRSMPIVALTCCLVWRLLALHWMLDNRRHD